MDCANAGLAADSAELEAPRAITLAGVLAHCERRMNGIALRDTRSAFRRIAAKSGIDLAAVAARPREVRALLAALSPSRLATSEKRLANIRSLVRKAVRRFGAGNRKSVHADVWNREWSALLATIDRRPWRWSLGRLAAYCSANGIAPLDVRPHTLIGFEAALENEALVKHPRAVLKSAIATWNQCRKRVPGWPQTALFSPFKQKPYMIEMAAFPEGFRRDVALWEARMCNPDPLDLDAPLRALRPDTLDGYRFCFRRLASALVHEGHVPLAAVTGLAVLVEGDNLKRALRPFLAREGRSTAYAWRMAAQMHAIARNFLRLPQERIDAIGTLVARLKPKGGGAMGERNRRRLAQFDDEVTVRRLLGLPREELARALRLKNPLRQAKAVERALAISLSIFASLRARNLRSLRLDRNFRRSGERLFLEFTADEMKSGAELTLELPQETIDLLDRFVTDHRSLLAGAGGPYLFPGENGGPRSYSAIRDAVGVYVRKRTGLDISPHLYRHATAKIVIERRPELAFDLSRRLGHKNVNTTYQAYLGTETPAASRRINELLEGVCANRRDPGTAKPRAKPPRKPAAGRRR